MLVFLIFNQFQFKINCHPCLLALQCSGQVTVMGCQAASEVLYQRIISAPDLLWRTILHSINVLVSSGGELLLSNKWTLRKEQQWTMWYLTFTERTQVHPRGCQIWSEAVLERITKPILQLFMHFLVMLKHHGPPVTDYQCWIFIYWGIPDISPWIWTRVPPKSDSEKDWKLGELDTGSWED